MMKLVGTDIGPETITLFFDLEDGGRVEVTLTHDGAADAVAMIVRTFAHAVAEGVAK